MSDAMPDLAGLPLAQFAFPGPLRDQLVAAVLSGEKTAGTCQLIEHEIDGIDPYEQVGRPSVMVDSDGRPVGLLVCTSVEIRRLGEVDLEHAIAEGEGFISIEEWRSAHERFWSGPEYLGYLGDRATQLDDDTLLVLERFEVVERL